MGDCFTQKDTLTVCTMSVFYVQNIREYKLYGTHKKREPSAKKIFAESKKGAEVCLSELLYPKNSSM